MKIFGKEILGGSLWAERVCGKDDIEGKAEIEVCMLRPGLGMIPSSDSSRNTFIE